jgi:hypothetical protein
MKPTRAHTRRRLRVTLLALSLAVLLSPAPGATPTPAVVRQADTALAGPARAAAPEGAAAPHGQPGSQSWALLLSGLTAVWAIGRRRVATIGSRSLAAYRVRRR